MIQLVPLQLGKEKISIPVCIIKGKNPGKRILITGGLDGDEYASIDACYKLIEELSPEKINGAVTIIPIVNIPGFESLRSFNPEDNKYPKNIYPGKKNGTSSEQLVYFLDQNYISSSDVWIDLHGGALTENLEPFAYFYETKNKILNETIEKIISSIPLDRLVYRKAGAWDKTDRLGKKGVVYTLIESGSSSNRESKWADIHVSTVKNILGTLKVLSLTNEKYEKRIYKKTSFYLSKKSGLWYPNFPKEGNVKKGEILGELRSLHQIRLGMIKAGEDGEVLWHIEGLSVKKGDFLCEIAHEKIS